MKTNIRNYRRQKATWFTLFFLLSSFSHTEAVTSLTSPDGRYVITVADAMRYSVTFDGKTIVEESQMGVDIDNRLFESALGIPRGNHENWCSDMGLTGIDEAVTVDTTWTPLYGENDRIRDHYKQIVLHYEKGSQDGAQFGAYDKRMYYAMDIVIRAYNEGIAFRYHFPETANSLFLHVTGEQTTFVMPDGTMAWYEEWAQGPFYKVPLKADLSRATTTPAFTGQPHHPTWFESERPLLMELSDGTYVALLEAAMKDYVRGKFRLAKENTLQVALYGSVDLISPYDTPWRVIMAGRQSVDLINHKDLLLNLNEPSEAELMANSPSANSDWTWIRPGKTFRAGRLDKASIMRSIDYCAEFGFDYVELDAGWYGPEGKVSSDATKVAETRDFNMSEVCQYAREKGIGVWLYINQRALYFHLDELLPLYHEWGVGGLKFGFVQIGNQQWSTWLHNAVAKCAEYHLMVDIHDEYRPTGLSRTYPHLLTQEGIGGNEEMPDAKHNVTLPFTRFLCGPADYTLCYFNKRVKNTKGHQLAMAAVYYSPLQFYFWYDNPFTDKGEEELQFWKLCPTTFNESRALDGHPGEYIVQARRSGDDWFVGCMTNTEGRTVTIATDFLLKGRKYAVALYNDDPALDTRTKVRTTHMTIKGGKPLTFALQPNGGAALHIRPQ